MDSNTLFEKLSQLGFASREAYLREAFSRNIGLFTQEEQARLSQATIAIPGMGGVGGVHLITMVRTGIGRFNLADFDTFEPANINRQFGASIPSFGRPKLEVMKELALSINPYLEIKEFPKGISEQNIDEFLTGVDIVMDGLDFFSFETRRLLFNRSREKGIYVITAGPMGFSAALLVFSPHDGMSFDEYFNVTKNMAEEDKHLHFALGLAPRPTHIKYMDLSRVDLKSKAGPSLNIACQLCSAIAATEAVKILLNKGKIKPVPHYSQFDPFLHVFRKGNLRMGNRNPIQRIKLRVVKYILNKNKSNFKTAPPEKPFTRVTSHEIPKDVIEYILKAGIQAPSGDNAQPWKFSKTGNVINVFLDKDADHSFFNVRQIASMISCGAVIENMAIAATQFGLHADIALFPDMKNEALMASIHLTVDSSFEKHPLADHIWHRCTNRKMYKKTPLSSEIMEALQNTITGFDGVNLHLVTDRPNLQKLAKLIYMADRIRTEHRPLHEHLNRMIRWTEEETLEKRDGFYLKNLEAGIPGEIFLKMTKPWWIMSLMNKIGLGRMVALHSLQGIVNSSAVGLLTTGGMTTEGFLKGGRALEQLWLTATRCGLSFQPMTAITLFWMRWLFGGEKEFLEKHQRLLNEVWQNYRTLFSDIDFTKHAHVMLFRVGYGKMIKFGTIRKNLENIKKKGD